MLDLISLDKTLFLIINSWHFPWLNSIMTFLSGQSIWIPFVLFIFFSAYKNLERKQFYLFMLFSALGLMASDATSSYLMKNIFERLRPCKVEELKTVIYHFGQKCGGKYGFVSSHTANSFCLIYFSLLIVFKQKWRHLLWILPMLVAYSRLYLGVHYPGDILGGFLIGLLWGGLFAYFFKHVELGSKSS